jgi:hypothetical protein
VNVVGAIAWAAFGKFGAGRRTLRFRLRLLRNSCRRWGSKTFVVSTADSFNQYSLARDRCGLTSACACRTGNSRPRRARGHLAPVRR